MTRERIVGYDVARALAMLGMIVVHFCPVPTAARIGPGWLVTILHMLDGRGAATFAVLAGVGVTLLTRRMPPAAARSTLVQRGFFLLAIGFVNLFFWPGDMLRMYGVSLIIASRLLEWSTRRLVALAAAIVIAFAALAAVVDLKENWDYATLTYLHTWTAMGLVRNALFDGFRSVLPWSAFVFFGMAVGRLDLTDGRVARNLFLLGIVVVALAQLTSRVLLPFDRSQPWFGTGHLPALPLFILSAGGTATAVIALCVRAAAGWPGRAWRPLAATGEMALTWYIAHILVGPSMFISLGLIKQPPMTTCALCAVLFFVAMMLISWGWKRHFRHGPLEWVMRVVSQGGSGRALKR